MYQGLAMVENEGLDVDPLETNVMGNAKLE